MSLESNRESVKLATNTILATAMARNAMLLSERRLNGGRNLISDIVAHHLPTSRGIYHTTAAPAA